jgi:hypothetical protein
VQVDQELGAALTRQGQCTNEVVLLVPDWNKTSSGKSRMPLLAEFVADGGYDSQ